MPSIAPTGTWQSLPVGRSIGFTLSGTPDSRCNSTVDFRKSETKNQKMSGTRNFERRVLFWATF